MDRFEAGDGALLAGDRVDALIQAMSSFVDESGFDDWRDALRHRPNETQAVIAGYWQGGTA